MKVSNCHRILNMSLIAVVCALFISCDVEPATADGAGDDCSDSKSRQLVDFCQHCLNGMAMYHCDALAHAGMYSIKSEYAIAKYDECYHSCDSSCMIELINLLD